MIEIEERVVKYWTKRMPDFSEVREHEWKNEISDSWIKEMEKHFPKGRKLKILDVGTGVGYFAVLLAKAGHDVCGIDLTPDMIKRARKLAEEQGLAIDYQTMDAMNLTYKNGIFDIVVTRNLTWTLPDVKQAYHEWFRVLKKEGLLLNFDANYRNTINWEKTKIEATDIEAPYGHQGMTKELEKENAYIIDAMVVNKEQRPQWDRQVLVECGFSECFVDENIGKRILREKDLSEAPMFLVGGRK